MRKVLRDFENPIDNILIDIAELLSPIAYFFGLTPNILTTISVIFSGFTLYYLKELNFSMASYMYMISYYFDCWDGFFARKYKMYSKFGDLYDHIADIIKFSSVSYMLFSINYQKFLFYTPIMIIFALLFNINLGYQELYYDKSNESNFLEIIKKLCIIKDKNNKKSILQILQYTKWLGCGTFNLIFCLIIYFY
jgi:phosphatidylglycerophosphate synthase